MPEMRTAITYTRPLVDVRLRSKIHPDEMEQKVGKILRPSDLNVLLTGPARVLKPDGDPLLFYLPGAMPQALRDLAYPVLTTIRIQSRNRGLAGGAPPVKVGNYSYANPVMSAIIGYSDPAGGRFPMCRTTAWTGEHTEQFRAMYPYFYAVNDLFQQYVPDRYAAQQAECVKTNPAWVIPGTVYSTVTVNNTYPTGVHKDVGDLHEGYSCLTTLRRGQYRGGILTFPEYRVGVDLQDGDVVLMDAHEWHGNTELERVSEDAERISVVLYYRTNMVACGTPEDELEKAINAKTVADDA